MGVSTPFDILADVSGLFGHCDISYDSFWLNQSVMRLLAKSSITIQFSVQRHTYTQLHLQTQAGHNKV